MSLETGDLASPQTSHREAPSRCVDAAIVCLPTAAVLVVLLLHQFVPNGQTPAPTRLYLLLLQGLLTLALLAVAAHWLWRPARIRESAPLAVAALLLLGVWDLVTLKLDLLPLPYFPGPDRILEGMADDRKLLFESTCASLRLLLCGYTVGVTAGLISGVLMGWFRRLRYWGMPVLKLVGPIPATAFVPLSMALFPDAFLSGIMLIALAIWFPVTMLTMSGITNVPASYFDVARTLGAGRRYLIFHVAVPAALPTIFIGLFMGLGASFLTLVVAETVGVSSGLGWYLKWQQANAEYSKLYGALFIMALFFSGLMTLLFKVRDRVLGWQKGVIRW